MQFASTVLYGAEISRPEGAVHVLGYQNKVGSELALPNAMLLPFPAVPATMGPANVLDTQACPHILQDIADALQPPAAGFVTLGPSPVPAAPPVQIFETGIYTVVLARTADLIPEALATVPEDRRPPLNPELFSAYSRWYPDWTMALCCFNNAQAALATPMLWTYQPAHPTRLFLPTLDCHTGDVPDLHAAVAMDHTIAVGSTIRIPRTDDRPSPPPPDLFRPDVFPPMTGQVIYRDPLPAAVQPYLLRAVSGRSYYKKVTNGDLYFPIDELRRGLFTPRRWLPPGSGMPGSAPSAG